MVQDEKIKSLINEVKKLENPIKTRIDENDMNEEDKLKYIQYEKKNKLFKNASKIFTVFKVFLFIAIFISSLTPITCELNSRAFGIIVLLLIYIIVYFILVKVFKKVYITDKKRVILFSYPSLFAVTLITLYSIFLIDKAIWIREIILLLIYFVLFAVKLFLDLKADFFDDEKWGVYFKYGDKEKEKKEEEQKRVVDFENKKKELESYGYVYVTQYQIDNLLLNIDKVSVCPFCSSQLEKNYDNYISVLGNHKKELTAVYVGNSYSNQVQKAIEYENNYEDCTVTKKTCPKCKYDLNLAIASNYVSDNNKFSYGGEKFEFPTYVNDKIPYVMLNRGNLIGNFVVDPKSYRNNAKSMLSYKLLTKNTETKKSDFDEAMNILSGLTKDLDSEKKKLEEKEKEELQKKLVKCVDCGNLFSPHATACPKCGCPIDICLKNNSKTESVKENKENEENSEDKANNEKKEDNKNE